MKQKLPWELIYIILEYRCYLMVNESLYKKIQAIVHIEHYYFNRPIYDKSRKKHYNSFVDFYIDKANEIKSFYT